MPDDCFSMEYIRPKNGSVIFSSTFRVAILAPVLGSMDVGVFAANSMEFSEDDMI